MRPTDAVQRAGCCALACLMATVATAGEYPRAVPLSPDAVREDLALARDALETIHPVYALRDRRLLLDPQWEQLEARADEMTDVELYVALSALTEDLRCDHTKLELPERLQSERGRSASFFPFRADVFGADVVVLSAADSSGFEPGDRIVSIDGRPIAEITEAVFALLPVDDYTDHVKPNAFAEVGDFGTSGFEHFYPLIFGGWSLVDVVVERRGVPLNVATNPITLDQWRRLPWSGAIARADFIDSVHFDVFGDGIGYLRVDTFVNYRRPIDPQELYGPIFERIAQEDIDTLILDTRRNGGGSDDAMVALMAYLLEEPFTLIGRKWVRTIDLSGYADHIDTWDPSALTPDPARFDLGADGFYSLKAEYDPLTMQPVEPLTPTFEGSVYALTSASNASAVTMMLATLRERGSDVTLIGERTGGSSSWPNAGVIYFLELPNSGITLRIPWQKQVLSISRPEPGQGVTPAVEVVPTAEDALAGRDTVLEVALELALAGQISDSSK